MARSASPARGNPAVDTARRFLLRGIERGAWSRTASLPSLQELAARAAVSRTSMWKAVAALKAEGIVRVTGGGHITMVPVGTTDDAMVGGSTAAWEKKRNLLGQDVLSGVFAPTNRLPSFNALTARYGVCNATMKKILDSLVEKKIVARTNRAYGVPRLQKKQFRSTIVVFSEPLSSYRSAVVVAERMQKLLDALEAECARAGYALTFETLDLAHPERTMNALRSHRRDQAVIGYLFNVFWWEPKFRMTRIVDLLGAAITHKKPIAIFDLVGEFSLQAGFASREQVHIFRTAGYSAGESIGRCLLKQGHRRLIFFSLHHAHSWSVARLRGITDLYTSVGLKSDVAAYCENEFSDNIEPIYTAFENDDAALEELFKIRVPRERFEWQVERLRKIRAQNRKPGVDVQALREVRTDFAALKGLLDRNMSPGNFAEIRMNLYFTLGDQVLDAHAEPLFERALSAPGVTAWVCSTDHVALAAQRFLAKKHAAVSVAGFDNTASSFENSLTSYDFNMATIAHRMLRFVLQPTDRANATVNGTTEVEGLIIERASTARPRKFLIRSQIR